MSLNLTELNNTNETNTSNEEVKLLIESALQIVRISIIFLTVIPNFLIIVTVIFIIKKKTYTNYLFMSMAMADLVIGAISLPFYTIYSTFKYWPLKQYVCIFWVINDYASCTVSICNLLLVTIQRFNHLVFPLKTSEKMDKLKVTLIALSWIIPYLFWSISALAINLQNDPNSTECYFMYTFTYVLLSDLFMYILPTFILILLSFLTILALHKRKKCNIF